MTPTEWIEYLRGVDTPTLVNAIELLEVRPNREAFTPLQIRCLFPAFGRMCGYAVTAQVETITQGEPFDLDRFVELYRLVGAAPKPAVIALQEIGGQPDHAAHCGEVMATFIRRLGAIGLVSDCGVRDIPEVRALGLHYFARGSVASHGNYRIARPGGPISKWGTAAGWTTIPRTPSTAITRPMGEERGARRQPRPGADPSTPRSCGTRARTISCCFTTPTAVRFRTTRGIAYRKSADNGKTWGPPSALDTGYPVDILVHSVS
jgi:regulator of RNase E activity RraA